MKNLLGSMNSRERTVDSLSRLRLALENVANSKKPHTRLDIFTLLYDALWGSYVDYFLPVAVSTLPIKSLAEMQAKSLSVNEPPVPGRPCGHIFQKGECCYRCKCAGFSACMINISESWCYQRLCPR
jgi:E3 ubiquitin-protein ligase UBR1